MNTLNGTHHPSLRSWVGTANHCERDGAVRIGLGECVGTVAAASAIAAI